MTNLGAPGWGESTTTWEAPTDCYIPQADGLWSYPGGVFKVTGCLMESGQIFAKVRVEVNHGKGWESFSEIVVAPTNMTDLMSFDPMMTGDVTESLWLWDERTLMNVTSAAQSRESFRVHNVFVVDETLAYAIAEDQRKVVKTGQGWSPIPADAPYKLDAIWANDALIVGVGSSGTIVTFDGSEWTTHASNTMDHLRKVWGFSATDLWVGSFEGTLLHYDGDSWQRVEWAQELDPTTDLEIQHLWGVDGVLFVATSYTLLRWQSGSFEVLGDWTGRTVQIAEHGWLKVESLWIAALWGHSPNDVFLSVSLSTNINGQEGTEAHILRFDGVEFHDI